MSIEKKDEDALREFLADIECLDALSPWTERFNIFDILKISRTEIRHSNMLSWLLDTNENHGLGDKFLKNMFLKILKENEDKEYDSFKLLLMDLYSFRVFREREHIDILLVSDKEKNVIAIENKIGSSEHNHQLQRYREYLDKEYKDYKKILVFLTPDGDEPSDKKWGILTYESILDILDKVYENNELQSDVDLLLKNYTDVVRRNIVDDQELVKVCTDIYNRHKKALDLIIEKKIDDGMQIFDVVSRTLKKLSEEGKIIYGNCGKLNFTTPNMDKLLPALNVPEGSWGTTNIYKYWVNLRNGKLSIVFELGGMNVPESSMKNMREIIKCGKPKNDKDIFKFKRIYQTKKNDLSNKEKIEEIEEIVEKAVNEVLKKETDIIKSINSKTNH